MACRAPHGIPDWSPTIADLLKDQGYATGQFGKNHLGDQDNHLPTNHGFDEFFGNLYHLNAEEEPETYYYPKDPEFRKKYGPRGVIHSHADGRIEDTGPLTRKRMETIDEEIHAAAKDFIDRSGQGRKAVLSLVQHDAHARLDPSEEGIGRHDRDRPLSRRHGRARWTWLASYCKKLEDLGIDRQHDRDLQHGQWCGNVQLAGRWHDPVLRRERARPGKAVSAFLCCALAWRHQARHDLSTTSSRRKTGCRRCWRRRASPTSSTK